MITSYRTVVGQSTGQYKEKGSKFLSFCYPVSDENEINAHLTALRKEYHDARHHCYAWVLGADKLRHRANDDGEPNHSAGDPILGQIRSKGLTNILIVVVRYFGGVKLGVGGLISAYKSAAEEALNTAIIEEKMITTTLKLLFPYESTSEIMRVVKEFDLKILEQTFQEACYMLLEGSILNTPRTIERLNLLKRVGVKLEIES